MQERGSGARRKEAMKERALYASVLTVGQLPRQRGEAETPTSNQPPRVNQGRKLFGPAALLTCPLASPRSQARAHLGPGGYCRRSGNGGPRLACLRTMVWLCKRASTTQLHQQTFKTLARGQASRGRRRKNSSSAASLGWLARSGEIKARGTSRGPCDTSHDDQGQAGASARSVVISSLVIKGQAQARSPEA